MRPLLYCGKMSRLHEINPNLKIRFNLSRVNFLKVIFFATIFFIISDNNNDTTTTNNGNFTCVFECTIVNLATYRQFTNAA